MEKSINKLSQDEILKNIMDAIFSTKKVIILTGAGISTLSGIPDFRGKEGIYNDYDNVIPNLTTIYLENYPNKFYEFYKEKFLLFEDIKPNLIHYTLCELEKEGHISYIITQNIDKLHTIAGSENVLEIHGDGNNFYCINCKKTFSKDYYKNIGYICDNCGSIIRPDIYLFNESPNWGYMQQAIEIIKEADILIVLWSSLTVKTARRLVGCCQEFIHVDSDNAEKNWKLKVRPVYIINNKVTYKDYFATTYISDLGEFFQKIEEQLNQYRKDKCLNLQKKW